MIPTPATCQGDNNLSPALGIMMSLGWQPGQTLGLRDSGLKKPIEAIGQTTKAGLDYFNAHKLESQIVRVLGDKGNSNSQDTVSVDNSIIASMFDEEDHTENEQVECIRSEIHVELFGEKVRCLIDTGSDITCISETFWETIKAKTRDHIALLPVKPIQIRGAVGQKSTKVQQMVLLPLNMHGILIETTFLIVPNLIRAMILGFDWLKLNNMVINLRNHTASLEFGFDDREVRIPFLDNFICQNEIREICKDNIIENDMNSLAFIDNIKSGVPISDEETAQLKQMLSEHGKVFTSKLGRANCYVHDIKMSNQTPFIKRSYPVPYAYRQQMTEKLTEMEEMGIISRASTPFCSPLTFTKKSDGSLRVLLDAREINKYMIAESEAPPMQIDVLNAFHGVKFISVIDLNNAYFQIPITETSKKYTGFTFNGKSYVYNVLPQGLKTSVGSFSRAMDFILGPDVRQFCVNYLDDLAILTTGTLDEHLQHIDIVLNKLGDAGLTCNLQKCKFICTEVKMLGHIVTTKGIKTDPEKVESIQKFPIPKKIKHLRAFLGLCNYYRRFIPDYSNIIQPLCELLRKDKPWIWTPNAQAAFEQLKSRFINTIMLHHPNINKPYFLQTDSSGVGLAGVLYQYDDKGEMKILGYCSKALKGPELRWTVTEQEFWAIIYCLRKFETYLRGSKLIIKTDHKALTFVRTWKLYNSRITRWILYLEQFDYQVEHVKGKDNVAVDVLSRYPPEGGLTQDEKLRCPEILYMELGKNNPILAKLKNIATFQAEDEQIQSVKTRLEESNLINNSGRLDRIVQQCKVIDGILYYDRFNNNELALFLPKSLHREMCMQVHEEMGHQGTYKIIKYMKDRFYWIGMNRDIKAIIRTCHICQLSKSNNISHVGECKSILTKNIGDLVMADLYGPLPAGRFGAAYILVIQDSFSKYVKMYDLRKATSKAVITKVKDFAKVIMPKIIMTDNGSQFISQIWNKNLSDMGIKVIHTTVRNPRPNTTERVNKELGRLFRTYCHKNHKAWPKYLPRIENLYNNTIHESTKFTPNQIVFGESTKLTIDKNLPMLRNAIDVDTIRKQVRCNLEEASIKRQSAYNKSHKLIKFQIGDLIKIRKVNKSDAKQKITKKFELLYEGPYVVAAVPFPNVYTLIDPNTKALRGNFNTIHLSRYYK